MIQIGRARRWAIFGVPCIAIAIVALGVARQVAYKVKTPQTIIRFVVADLFPPIPATRATETTSPPSERKIWSLRSPVPRAG